MPIYNNHREVQQPINQCSSNGVTSWLYGPWRWFASTAASAKIPGTVSWLSVYSATNLGPGRRSLDTEWYSNNRNASSEKRKQHSCGAGRHLCWDTSGHLTHKHSFVENLALSLGTLSLKHSHTLAVDPRAHDMELSRRTDTANRQNDNGLLLRITWLWWCQGGDYKNKNNMMVHLQ